jgi:hypothetical protein
MNEGVGTSVADKSGQGNNGTVYGATWVSREGSVPATVNTNIVAQSIGNIGIDIKAQTLSQLNVNIAAQSVDVNIKTSGGANIVIDKLTQSAYTERRSTLSNNGATATLQSGLSTTKRGKFFPRGCRGVLEAITIYCDNADTAAHTLTVKVTPHPGMGPAITATLSLSAGAAAGWQAVTVRKMWNYDSMFIWVASDSDTYGRVGYDSGEPCDGFSSTDEATWTFQSQRLWITVDMKGETIGDLPVSGVVNNIAIPNTAARRDSGVITVPSLTEAYDTPIRGAGELLIAIFYTDNATAATVLEPRISVDGQTVLPHDTTLSLWRSHYVGSSTGPIYIGVWDTTNNWYTLVVALRIPFKRELKLGFYNSASVSYAAMVFYTYTRLE